MGNAFSTVSSVFVNTVLPIFVVIGIGFFAQKKLSLNLSTIARLGLYILSPCLNFSALYHSRLTGGDAFGLIAISLVTTAVLLVLGVVTGRVLKQNRSENSAFLLSVLFTNAGNYGIPLLELAFGRVSRDLAVICFVTQQVLFNTLAVYLATNGKLTFKQALRQIARMPVTYAVPAALFFLFTGIPLPAPIEKSVTLLGDAALAVILLSLGFQLAETRPSWQDIPRISVAVAYRLVLSPAIALVLVWFLAPLFAMSGLAAKVAVVAAAMPTAVTVVLLSIEFDADAKFVASAVFVGTLVSAFSLTFILTLLI